jgi:hypothetical protein
MNAIEVKGCGAAARSRGERYVENEFIVLLYETENFLGFFGTSTEFVEFCRVEDQGEGRRTAS